MKDLGRIRRLFYRDGVSLSEISRKTGYSRNTVKRWLRTPEGTEPKYERENPNVKIAPYAARLIKALETDARRPKRDRRTALKLFGELQAAGFTGTYCRVTEFIRRWRSDGGAAVSKAFVPLHFELGEAFQFDWSEEHLVIGGVWRKILASHLKFCASRAFVVQAYPTQGHEMLFDAHTRSFAALGGIPRRGIYDNMKTAVDKVQKGKSRIVNARFSAMASHYLFDPDFCNVASGWEKGVVEKNVQDSRLRLWQDAGKERFSSFTELNVCPVCLAESPHLHSIWGLKLQCVCEKHGTPLTDCCPKLDATQVRSWLAEHRIATNDWLSVDLAARVLGVKQQVAYELVAKGLLKTTPCSSNARAISAAQLQAFKNQYVSLVEIATNWGRSPKWVFLNIEASPVCGPSIDGTRQYFFLRADVRCLTD